MQVQTLYPWLDQHWLRLVGYLRQKRIPQALLINGCAGLGTLELAENYARALLCESPDTAYSPCGDCHGCRLLDAQTHPDFITVTPEEVGKAIGIDHIRQLIARLALKPQFQGHRVVLIHPADALNNAAANAFLKCLEEPTERTSIVLVTEKSMKLPATIRSRCQKIMIEQPDTTVSLEWLKNQRVENADRLLQMAQGAALLAKQYGEQNLLSVYDEVFNDWIKAAQGKINVVNLAEQWSKQERVSLSMVLAWMCQWLTFMMRIANHSEACPLEQKDALKALLNRLDLQALYRFYDIVLASIAKLDTQLNKQLMIERILIEWAGLYKR